MTLSSRRVRDQISKIFATKGFQRAPRRREFLRFIVEESLSGRAEHLKEYSVGVEVYRRGTDFDPKSDATVRVEAGKLRERLERYYCAFGKRDPIRIALPKGSYAPEISMRDNGEAESVDDLCSQGGALLALRTPDALEQARSCFWKAVTQQPNLAAGYSGLATYYLILLASELMPPDEALPHIRMALAQAVQLGSTTTDTLVLRSVLANAGSGAGFQAEALLRRAVSLDRRNPNAHFWYAGALSSLGQHERALEHIRTAATLEPQSPLYQSHVSWILYYAGKAKQAREWLRCMYGADRSPIAEWMTGLVETKLGRFDEGVEALTKTLQAANLPFVLASLAYSQAKAGSRADAEASLERLRQLGINQYISPIRYAIVLNALGYSADALRALKAARHERSYALIWSKVDPQIESIHRRGVRL